MKMQAMESPDSGSVWSENSDGIGEVFETLTLFFSYEMPTILSITALMAYSALGILFNLSARRKEASIRNRHRLVRLSLIFRTQEKLEIWEAERESEEISVYALTSSMTVLLESGVQGIPD